MPAREGTMSKHRQTGSRVSCLLLGQGDRKIDIPFWDFTIERCSVEGGSHAAQESGWIGSFRALPGVPQTTEASAVNCQVDPGGGRYCVRPAAVVRGEVRIWRAAG